VTDGHVHGANVREAREARGFGRTEFAEMMGVSLRHLAALERDLTEITEQELSRVRFLTNLPTAFFTRTPRPIPCNGTLFVCQSPPWA
jgi:transcriptional regulator with XRE-family HTH domain